MSTAPASKAAPKALLDLLAARGPSGYETAPAAVWRDAAEGEGQEFLRQATQVKNIWVPYGE